MALLASSRLRLFIGAALISLSPVWVALADVSATTSGFYRVLFGSAALLLYLVFAGKRLQLNKLAWRLLLLATFFLVLDLWFWHRSILYIGPGLATLLANFQVFIMMIAGVLLLKQTPTKVQIIAAPLALLGLGLIVGLDWQELTSNYQMGVVYGLLTAVVYAGYLLSLRQARKGSSFRVPAREVAVVSVITTFVMAGIVVGEGGSFAIPTIEDAGWLIGYGVLSHCIGWLFIASSLPEVTTTEAGLALLLQPTLSFVWDVLIFDRPMLPVEFVGAAIALLAIYLGSRTPSKEA